MKSIANPGCRLTLFVLILATISLMLIGCGGTPGETGSERASRYDTIMRSNFSAMKSDLDVILMMDKRSKLSKNLVRDY